MKSTTLMLITILLTVTAAPSVQAQTYSVLYNFGSKSGDPCQPAFSGIIAQGRDGNLYSTAPGCAALGDGAVFKITLPTNAFAVVYSFDGTHGTGPQGGLTLGRDGNFYGTTQSGGKYNAGTVFKITPGGSLTVLHNFAGSDGEAPYAPPIEGTDGSFYGTTCAGGSANFGLIYKITSSRTFTPLYQFDAKHGTCPYGPLLQATDGNFYGTAFQGGLSNAGVVFRVTATGKLKVLYNFDFTHGTGPAGPLVQASDGNFYGTTTDSGTSNNGTVFKITPTGNLSVLHNMNGTTDGGFAWAGLVQATDGNFYGATNVGGDLTCNNGVGCGTLFKITPPPSSTFSVLHNFEVTTGFAPYVTPFQHSKGVVYGDTAVGGTGNVSPCNAGGCGVFYSWSAPGLKPFVSLLPYSGKVGNTIEFLGQGFTPSTTVSFNGTAAARTVVSGTYLTATVPNGATTGPVTVTTLGDTLKSNKIFRVIPQIAGFSPTSGPVGTSVIIKGISLKQTTKVTFGGVPALSFAVNSDMQVTATVPAGAKTGTITVTTPGGNATSSEKFTVT